MNVIITIPAYNEENTIRDVIISIKEVMKKTNYKYKIIVVDDGSIDKTKEIAEKTGAIVFSHPKNYGLAETFRTEIEKCLEKKADIIVHTDADGQYPPEYIPQMIKEVKNGYDLVLGNRFAGGIEEMPLIKKIGNKAFSRIISNITNTKIGDCQTGFRAFTKEVALKIKIRSNHTYTQEQIIKTIKEKFRIKEIPVYFEKRKHGKSKLIKNPFEYAFKAWINILKIYRDYEPLKFFGYLGAIFLVVGFIIGSFLIYRFITLGKIGHLPLTILTALLVLIGLQIILFGFLADTRKE